MSAAALRRRYLIIVVVFLFSLHIISGGGAPDRPRYHPQQLDGERGVGASDGTRGQGVSK